MRFIGQRITCLCFLQFRYRRDVSGMKFQHRKLRLPLKQNDRTKTLGGAFVHIKGLKLRCQCARVDTKQRDSPGEGIRKGFEHKCGEWVAIGNLSLNFLAMSVLARDASPSNG